MNNNLQEKLIALIDKKQEDIIRFIQDLIRIPSVNSPPTGQEKKCQLFIADRLRRLGMEVDIFSPDEIKDITSHPYYNPGRDYKDRPNVVGVLKGSKNGRSLLLTGHADVVSPGDLNRWKYDPWSATIDNGRIYGCGSADTKGGLGAQIMAVECIRELGIDLDGDLILASVVDEEFGGMNGSLACVLRGYTADGGILAEPTQLQIQPATAGGQQYRIRIKGKAAFEGDKHLGVSAIEKMYKVIKTFQELEKVRNVEAKKHPLFSMYSIPAPIVVIAIGGGDAQVGGVPDNCTIEVWHGVVPGETEEEVLGQLQEWLNRCSNDDPWLKKNPPQVEPVIKWMAPCEIPVNHPVVKTVESAVYKTTGARPVLSGMRGACDLSRFIVCGNMPTLVFGPGNSSQAHTPDEYVPIEEIITATKVVGLSILSWCNQS